MQHDLVGQTLEGRYRFEALLGEGTFARVYRITDLHRRATLAAKVLRRDVSAEAAFVERFRREADVLARLQHPNIVRFYGVVDLPEALFILVDYIPGQTLDTRLHLLREPLRPFASLTYLTPLASALHFAHGEGVIHRDLKPSNVLLHENGTLYVADFGIARLLNTVSELTLGAPIGTPNYMAPEQIVGEPATPQTDIYALGVMLYRMVAGRVPFRGDSPGAEGSNTTARITYEQVHVPPPAPSRFNALLDRAVEEVVLRCLAKSPAERFGSVVALYDALTEAVGAPPISLDDTSAEALDGPPGVKLPEWSRLMPPVDDDTPALDKIQPILVQEKPRKSVKTPPPSSAGPPPNRIEHPAPPPETEPHFERIVNSPHDGSLTLPSLGRALRRDLTPNPSIRSYTPVPGPAFIAPPRAGAPRRKSRRTLLLLTIASAGLVLLVSCLAALYVAGIFESAGGLSPSAAPDSSHGAVVTVPGAAGANPRGGQRVTFDSARDGDLDLYVVNLDGSDLQQLTGSGGAERGPAWSPDGSELAFYGAAVEDGNYDIFLMNADGTRLRNLTQTPDVDERYPTWSPDGTRLAYHGNADGDYDIYVMNADGSSQTKLTNNDVDDLGPDWSPEGTQIAYHTDQWGAPYELAVINVDTRQVRRLTDSDDTSAFPTWSPDGSRIAYNRISATDGLLNIYVLTSNEAVPQALTSDGNRSGFPDWSPDGRWIVYQRGEPGVSAIYRIPVDGGTPEALTGQQSNFLPDWEPFH